MPAVREVMSGTLRDRIAEVLLLNRGKRPVASDLEDADAILAVVAAHWDEHTETMMGETAVAIFEATPFEEIVLGRSTAIAWDVLARVRRVLFDSPVDKET